MLKYRVNPRDLLTSSLLEEKALNNKRQDLFNKISNIEELILKTRNELNYMDDIKYQYYNAPHYRYMIWSA